MKASELIKKLKTNIETFGDLELRYQYDSSPRGEVDGIVYTKHTAKDEAYLTIFDEYDKPYQEVYVSGDKLFVKEAEYKNE